MESGVEMSERRYPVIIEQTGTGFSAYSPDIAGCAAAGDTLASYHKTKGVDLRADTSVRVSHHAASQ